MGSNKHGSYDELLNDERLEAWLKAVSKDKGKYKGYNTLYLSAWNLYLKYHKEANGGPTTPTKLLKKLKADRNAEIEDQGVIEQDINSFAVWARNEDYAAGSIGRFISALRSFYGYYGFPLLKHKLRIDDDIKRSTPKPENKKIVYRPEHINRLLDVVKSLRDKAIILTMFQSGMDISTTASLNYGHISEALNRHGPIMINIIRKKSGIDYRTFIGRDCIKAIMLYIGEREYSGEVITNKTPLFVQEGKHAKKYIRLKTKNFQDNLRGYALKADLVSEERLNDADFNPARPHAIRTGFSTILKLKGVNQDIVDGFLGHGDKYNKAYTEATDEELKEIYENVESFLSVTTATPEVNEIEIKLRKEIEKERAYTFNLEQQLNELTGRLEVIEKVLNTGS